MTIKVTHIYKETDNCVDKMVNIDLSATTYMWCNDLSYLIIGFNAARDGDFPSESAGVQFE
jgi:hypothetical protein